jgi:hypothetical protein
MGSSFPTDSLSARASEVRPYNLMYNSLIEFLSKNKALLKYLNAFTIH